MISIIIPAYNTANYIQTTLESLCVQTYNDIEIVVVNDGSTDNTLDVVSEFAKKDSRIKIYSKENGGVTSARIFGVEKAKGEWIAFCDSDDTVDPEMYEILIKNAKKYHADISHCGYRMVFPSREVKYHGTNKLIEQSNTQGLVDLLSGDMIEPGLCNKLYKKTIIDEFLANCSMDSSIKINEDLLMNYYLFKLANKSVFVDKCLYNYIVHENSAANSTLKPHHLNDPIKVMENICTNSNFNSDVNNVATIRYIDLLIRTATMEVNSNKKLIMPYQKKCRKKLLSMFIKNLLTKSFSIKFKCKIILATIFPDIYKLIHIVYSKITGLDKIYDIN